jgi:hypothetical protein
MAHTRLCARTHFYQRMGPVLETLIEAATAADAIRADVSATDVLHAVALLCQPVPGEGPATADAWSTSSSTACGPDGRRWTGGHSRWAAVVGGDTGQRQHSAWPTVSG